MTRTPLWQGPCKAVWPPKDSCEILLLFSLRLTTVKQCPPGDPAGRQPVWTLDSGLSASNASPLFAKLAGGALGVPTVISSTLHHVCSGRENTVSDPLDSLLGDPRLPVSSFWASVSMSVRVVIGPPAYCSRTPGKRGRGLALERVRSQVHCWLKSPLRLLEGP